MKVSVSCDVDRSHPEYIARVVCRAEETGGRVSGSLYERDFGPLKGRRVCGINSIDSGFPRSRPREGIGTQLLSRYISVMRGMGCEVLSTTPASDSAQALYRSFVRRGVLSEPIEFFPSSGNPSAWFIEDKNSF